MLRQAIRRIKSIAMDGRTAENSNVVTRVTIVTDSEQLLHAYAVRSICFMEETGLTAQRAFDGNDFQATHIVVYAGDEPVGAARVRWFSGFAKIERTAFRKAWRNPRVLKQAAEFIFEHAARKGYSKVITLAKPQYAMVWMRLSASARFPAARRRCRAKASPSSN